MLRIQARNHVARRYAAVVLAASAGGVTALKKLLSQLPPDFPLPIAVVQHRSGRPPNILAKVLGLRAPLKVKQAEDREVLQPGTVYLAPPDLHMTVEADRSIRLTNGHKVRHVLSSANPLFESAAEALEGRVIAVVLTGFDRDGTDGVQAVKQHGGIVIAQDEATSQVFGMPHSAILTGVVDHVLPLDQIAGELARLARMPA